jgi:hypothetical protein
MYIVNDMNFNVKDFASIGGASGLVLFFLFGLTPSIAFGSSAADSLASTFLSDRGVIGMLMILGAVICLFLIAGTFTATFAAAGAAFGAAKNVFKSK